VHLLSFKRPQGAALALAARDLAGKDLHVRGADLGFAVAAHEHVHKLAIRRFREFDHDTSSLVLFSDLLGLDLLHDSIV
jgi:hypothetical protein